jgi:hypothetical protein
LTVYAVIVAGCGAVMVREVYYALATTSTLATVRSVGSTRVGARGGATYHVDYDFLDAHGALHTGRGENVFPSIRAGDQVKVQYLRHSPTSSRLAPSPVRGLSYGAIALLAAVAFAAEIVLRRQGRRRRGTGEAGLE